MRFLPYEPVAAHLSSNFSGSGEQFCGAEKCIDHDHDTQQHCVQGSSLCHTAKEESPWLEVDLGAILPVGSVVIWNRLDCCRERLGYFELYLSADPPFAEAVAAPQEDFIDVCRRCHMDKTGDELHHHHCEVECMRPPPSPPSPPPPVSPPPRTKELCATGFADTASVQLVCSCVGVGKYVTLVLPGAERTLHVQEIRIYGPAPPPPPNRAHLPPAAELDARRIPAVGARLSHSLEW